MNRRFLVLAAVSVAALIGAPAHAQSTIAQRVANAPAGVVRMQFASRAGVCGDGEGVIGYHKAIFAGSVESFGDWITQRCVPGPVRVALTVADGKVTKQQTFIGGSWARTSGRVTDLGTVSATDASAYFFSIIPQLEKRSARRYLLPAVLGASDGVVPRLVSLAGDDSRADESRSEALHWIGLLGDGSVVPFLVSVAKQGAPLRGASDDIDNDDEKGKSGLATKAIASLSFLERGVGIPSLIGLAKTGPSGVRSASVFWLGQSGDPRALAALHSIIENDKEDERVRARAIFSLAHGDGIPESEFEYLRAIYTRLSSDRLKETILQGAAEERSGSDWLLVRAKDRSDTMKMRKSALFWAGQRDFTSTKDIVSFYSSISEPELREHAIFVLSQRDDPAAADELLRIARSDPDRKMRSKALFWLGQKDDPRVAKLISEKLSK